MVVLYYEHFSQPLLPQEFEECLNSLPKQISNRIKNFRKWQDAHACLLGKMLLLKGLRDFNVSKSLLDLKYSTYNRPYFDCESIDFNISHSGNSVICAISNEGIIGADIEEIQPIEIQDFYEQFQCNEWSNIISSNDRYNQFFTYWTQKEAAVKADGRGLSIPLNQVRVDNNMVLVEMETYRSYEVFLTVGTKCYLSSKEKIKCIFVQHNPLGSCLEWSTCKNS